MGTGVGTVASNGQKWNCRLRGGFLGDLGDLGRPWVGLGGAHTPGQRRGLGTCAAWALRAALRCSGRSGSGSNSASPQTIASPDPIRRALLGHAKQAPRPRHWPGWGLGCDTLGEPRGGGRWKYTQPATRALQVVRRVCRYVFGSVLRTFHGGWRPFLLLNCPEHFAGIFNTFQVGRHD